MAIQTVSWIPADAVAKTYVDLVLSKDHLPSILNLVHPHPVKWQDIVQSLNSAFGKHPLGVVPYADWLAKVEELPVNSLSMDRFVSACASAPEYSRVDVFTACLEIAAIFPRGGVRRSSRCLWYQRPPDGSWGSSGLQYDEGATVQPIFAGRLCDRRYAC